MTRVRIPSPQHRRQPPSPFKTAPRPKNTFQSRHEGNSGHLTRRRFSHASAVIKKDKKHEFPPDEVTFYDADVHESQHGTDEVSDNEDSLFYWEEEDTLLSELLDSPTEEPTEHDLDVLVDSLQSSFDQRGRELKKDIAETLVPTVNRVKAMYRKIDTEVDEEYAKGVLTFNKACKDLESLAIRDQDDFRHAWLTTRTKIEDLIRQLGEAYKTRERLWADFEDAFDNIVNPTLALLRETPANVERTIASLDKRARALEKDDATAMSAAEKNIMGLLRKPL